MADKRAFVSDIHMGGTFPGGAGKHDWNWLSGPEIAAFASFLDYVGNSGEYKELIILGDFLDDWVWPVHMLPPTLDEIVEAPKNKAIVDALRVLCQKIKVICLPGNHDMGITKEFLDRQFPGIVFGGPAKDNCIYRTGRLRAEHGSAHALFNAPDPHNNPGSRVPLGYYISRVVATRKYHTGQDHRKYASFVDDLFEAVGPQSISASVFEGVLEEAGLPGNVEILIRDAGGNSESVKANEIKTKYQNLFDQWCQAKGFAKAMKAIYAE
ncbi:MAG: metallophosphoesterase, partial [Proteobacteria bacterium]|nr:metallophosphoesterase [Pseudomonadota bacterium]MBU1612097.1 metallophosphoesterase [Pseudomonadota bacterium]